MQLLTAILHDLRLHKVVNQVVFLDNGIHISMKGITDPCIIQDLDKMADNEFNKKLADFICSGIFNDHGNFHECCNLWKEHFNKLMISNYMLANIYESLKFNYEHEAPQNRVKFDCDMVSLYHYNGLK